MLEQLCKVVAVRDPYGRADLLNAHVGEGKKIGCGFHSFLGNVSCNGLARFFEKRIKDDFDS